LIWDMSDCLKLSELSPAVRDIARRVYEQFIFAHAIQTVGHGLTCYFALSPILALVRISLGNKIISPVEHSILCIRFYS